MRGQRILVAVLLGGGCNPVFGIDKTLPQDAAPDTPDADLRPDRDHDGVADVEDPCIAAAADFAEDTDGDTVVNGDDVCPFFPPLGPDSDGDGMHDVCDPFPMVPGDSHRCAMRLYDPELNASLWKARPGEIDLALASGYLIGFEQDPGKPIASVIAQERIAPATGSIRIEAHLGGFALPYRMRMWVSAAETPSASDVACEVYADPTALAIQPIGASMSSFTPSAEPVDVMDSVTMYATVQPGKAGLNLICLASYGDAGFAYGGGHVDGPLGQQGFAVYQSVVIINAIGITHRPDQPPLM